MFSNENGAPFSKIHHNVLQNYCDLQRFQNTIPDLRKVEFRNGKTPFPQVGICITEPLCFPMEMEANSAKLLKCTSELLCFTTFSERNFRLTGNEVFPLEKSTKLVIGIAFWNTFVFQ